MSERAEGPQVDTPRLAEIAARLERIKNLLTEAMAGIRSVGSELRRIQGSRGSVGESRAPSREAVKVDLSGAKEVSESLYTLWQEGRRGEVLEKLRNMNVASLKNLCQVMSLGANKRAAKQSLIDAILSVFSQRVLLSSNVIVEEREAGKRRER